MRFRRGDAYNLAKLQALTEVVIHPADRKARLAPLGPLRLRVLDCLGGNSPWAPGYFRIDASDDVFTVFRTYVLDMSRRWADNSDPVSVSLLAAARFLTGELAGAQTLVDHLPAEAIELDHGAGVCRVAAFQVVAPAAPLPAALKDWTRWLAGSAEAAAVRNWLTDQGSRLRWLEQPGVYERAT